MDFISGGGGGRTTDAEDITSGTFVKERIPPLPTTKIAEGTFDLARIPAVDDARIPDLETLSYGGAFVEGQIPNLPTSKITTGTFGIARIPTMDDAHIPDLETLSYGAAFAEAQIPNLPTSKITSGTFDDARIPNIGLNDLEDVNTAGTVNGKVLTFQSGTWLPETPAGGGDMLKSVYDTDGDDIVDNSERLENQTLGSVQDHNVVATKITSGTIGLARIPSIDDAHIPDLETLSYGAAFGTAQIPNLPTTKITSGTFNADRIPILPTDRYGSAVLVSGTRVMEGDFTLGSHALKFNNMVLFEADADWLHLMDIAGGVYKKFKAHTLNTSYGQIFYGSTLMFDFWPTYIVTAVDLNMNSKKIFNLLDPTADQHAATKFYVDRHPKTLWVPVTWGALMTHYGYYPVARLADLLDEAGTSFHVPDDFHSITKAVLVVIPRATQAAADWDIHSHYAAAGEAYNTHFGHDLSTAYNVTDGQIFEVDISTILTSLAAGDYVGVDIELGDAAHDVDVLGVMFKYT